MLYNLIIADPHPSYFADNIEIYFLEKNYAKVTANNNIYRALHLKDFSQLVWPLICWYWHSQMLGKVKHSLNADANYL